MDQPGRSSASPPVPAAHRTATAPQPRATAVLGGELGGRYKRIEGRVLLRPAGIQVGKLAKVKLVCTNVLADERVALVLDCALVVRRA